MAIQHAEVNLAAQTAYQTNPDVTLAFQSKRLQFVSECTDRGMYVSFDGANDHVYVPHVPAIAGHPIVEIWQRVEKIWMRASAAGGATPVLHVMAEQY